MYEIIKILKHKNHGISCRRVSICEMQCDRRNVRLSSKDPEYYLVRDLELPRSEKPDMKKSNFYLNA